MTDSLFFTNEQCTKQFCNSYIFSSKLLLLVARLKHTKSVVIQRRKRPWQFSIFFAVRVLERWLALRQGQTSEFIPMIWQVFA